MSQVSDHCTREEFEELLDAAEEGARTDREEEFISDLREKWDEYGIDMYLSDKQREGLVAVSIEGFDVELGKLAFHVEGHDECTAHITVSQGIYTAESWRETAEQIGRAIEMLNLEE